MTGTIARSAVINLRVRFLRARNRIGRQEPRSRGGYYVARFAVPIFFLASPPSPRVADSQFRRGNGARLRDEQIHSFEFRLDDTQI